MTVHELKCWPVPFAAMRDGSKRFEYRKDDRGYQVGDVLWNREWEPPAHVSDQHRHGYTGREDRYRVTYKLAGRFGVPDGYCVLGVEPLANHDPAQVIVMGRKDVQAIREALEWASVNGLDRTCPYCDRASNDNHSERCIVANAIALLPLTSTPTEETAGEG
jgi:hypothetical protein